MKLTDEQVRRWLTDGYTVVKDLLTPDEVAAARENIHMEFPTRERYDAEPEKRPKLRLGMAFRMLPFAGDALNATTFHPRLIACAEQLLQTADIRLTQSILRVTYGGDTADQELHRDYHNNSLLVPPKEPVFRQLAVIIHYSDVTVDDAPTYVVSNKYTRDMPYVPHHIPASDAPEMYEYETPNVVSAGSALFYTMRTFHRGSAMRNPNGYRFVHHTAWRAAGDDWMDFNPSWPTAFDCEDGVRCIEMLSPRQRELIGFPGVGHPYWTDDTIAGIVERYPNFDASPYEIAARPSSSQDSPRGV